MDRQEFSDETLVAFADGELEKASVSAVKAAIESDPALAKRLEVFVATRNRLRDSLGPIANEPVPDRLTDLVMGGGAATAEAGNRPVGLNAGRRAAPRFVVPMAAAIACLVAGVSGYLIGSLAMQDTGTGLAGMTASAEPGLRQLLTASPDNATALWSAGGRSGEVAVHGTYRTRTGLCRSFSVSEQTGAVNRAGGVACLGPGGWQTQVVAAERPSDGAVTPAGNAGQVVDAFLDAAEAGDPLDAAAVRELIAKGWR